MRINFVSAKKIHGFLNLDIKFNDNITFITGNNGCGKTTALNLIEALLAPNFSLLSKIDFQEVTISCSKEEKEILIKSKKNETQVEIEIVEKRSNTHLKFVYSPYQEDVNIPSYKNIELQDAYYRNLVQENQQNEVIKFYTHIPTPMILGIDRRLKGFDYSFDKRHELRYKMLTRKRINPYYSASLNEACLLAEDFYRTKTFEVGNFSDTLRNDLILNLFFKQENIRKRPDPASIDIESVIESITQISTILNIDKKVFQKRVEPIKVDFEKIKNNLPTGEIKRELNEKEIEAIIDWSSYRYIIKGLQDASELVQRFNDRKSDILKPIDDYLNLLNSFFIETGKKIRFNAKGELVVIWEKFNGQERQLDLLSSGESQLFTIITSLSFQQDYNPANIFIIDEPELSLHISWQEKFVESLIKANPKTQYILSTHSPSIILDRVSDCVKLN